MSEAARIGAKATARPRVRINLTALALVGLALGAGAYYAVCGLLIHLSFHSFGWDLGIFDQVLWSIANGHGFHYSFRDMPYLGDHFQPVLILLAPLVFLKLGAAPILVVQGLAFGAAVIPLHSAVRRLGGPVAAWGLSIAYVVSLGPVRAVGYDFHPECFVPVLAFAALWGLAAKRPGVFAAACVAMLPIKEDMALLVLGLCWVAWLGFGQRKAAQWVALGSIAYFVVISGVVMPQIADGAASPLSERYPYLGDSTGSIVWHAITRPDLIVDHLWRWGTPRTLLYLFAGVGFLPLLRPKLLLPIVLLLMPPMLAVTGQQRMLELHYGVVPYAFTFVVAAMVLDAGYLEKIVARVPSPPPLFRSAGEGRSVVLVSGVVAVLAVVMFAWKSPLPPSFAAHWGQFDVDGHSEVAQSFVDDVPGDAVVSAQASFVPHLSQRYEIFEFPEITSRSTIVLLDDKRPVWGYEWFSFDLPWYNDCRAALPSLGFRLVREEDGIEMWERSEADAMRLGSEGCE